MLKQISKLLKSSTVFAVLLVSGCGGGSPAARDGSVLITPTDVTANISGISTGTCSGVEYSYTKFVITILNASGSPVPDAGMSVTLDWSSGTDTGFPAGVYAMTLYDDPNWSSGSTTPPTNAVGGSYSTKTGSSGTKTLIVGQDLSCTYTGNLYVYYGALSQKAVISITSN